MPLVYQRSRKLGRENISVGTWNVRNLRPAWKFEQLTHAISRYHRNIVGLCEMRWKNFGEMSTDDGHKVYFIGMSMGLDFLCTRTQWMLS